MQKVLENLTQNVLGCGLVLLLLVGCSNTKTLEIQAKPIEKPSLVLPKADQVDMRNVTWVLITRENYEEMFALLEKDTDDVVFFGLSDEGYERLSLNLSDVRAFIQQQQSIIAAYERYYTEAEKALDQANAQTTEENQRFSFFKKLFSE